MKETVKRLTLAISQENLNRIEFLMKHFGERAPSVIRRAIDFFYNEEVWRSIKNEEIKNKNS